MQTPRGLLRVGLTVAMGQAGLIFGLGWVHQLVGRVGSGRLKLTHAQLNFAV